MRTLSGIDSSQATTAAKRYVALSTTTWQKRGDQLCLVDAPDEGLADAAQEPQLQIGLPQSCLLPMLAIASAASDVDSWMRR